MENNVSPKDRLPRALGLLMAMAVVVGTVIGSGIFKKPQSVAENVPSFSTVTFVWIIGGVLAMFGSLSLAEVAILYPRAGGNYVFLREGFGRMCGFLWGWVEFGIIKTASIAALATIVTESLHDVLRAIWNLPTSRDAISYWDERLITVGIIAGLALVNIRGVRWGGYLQLFVTLVKVGSLLAIILLPFLIRGPLDQAPTLSPAPKQLIFTWGGLGTAMLGVQWAYHGWMNVAAVAGEVRHPQRNIPLAMIAGVGLVIVLYLGANVAYYQVIPHDEMKDLKNTTVATAFGLRLLGPVGAGLAAAAVMCSAFGALNGNILAAPRVLYAMAQDKLVPQALGAVHRRFQTPAVAIVVAALWSCALVLGVAALCCFRLPIWDLSENYEINLNLPAGKAAFDVLTDFAMFGAVIFETMAVATIFVFRARLPNAERPYRCIGYPVVPAVYVFILVMVAASTVVTQRVEAAVGLGFIALGAAIYGLFLRRPLAA